MKIILILPTILLCNSTLSVAESQLTLSPSLVHFDYTEFGTANETLDRELGWLPGLEFKLSHTITTNWSVDIYSAYYQGTVDYDGQTQSGNSLTTNTDTMLLRFGGQITTELYKKTGVFAGTQLHQWNRDINSTANTSGIDEIYNWVEYSIGIKSDFFINQNNNLNIDIAYLLIRNTDLDVDLSRVDLGSTTLDLGDGTGTRLNLNWKRIAPDNTHYDLSLFIELWEFGRSNSKLTQGGSPNVLVTEPRSETQNIGVKLNIEYVF